MDALYATKKITQLYAHQAEAINWLGKGENVVVSTSTSSGKSLIYQIPALCEFEKDPGATALYIFPTKALAQDQKRSLIELLGCCEGLEDIKVRLRQRYGQSLTFQSPGCYFRRRYSA